MNLFDNDNSLNFSFLAGMLEDLTIPDYVLSIWIDGKGEIPSQAT